MRIFDIALSAPWAILPENLEQILSIASRAHEAPAIETLEKYRSDRLSGTQKATIRDGVGIIPISGPLFKGANLMTEMSGATSYDIVAKDLHAALDNPEVSAILLKVDSPGGTVSGCDELAQMIFEARGEKEIYCHASGTMASAAYWIGSACEKIYISDATMVGSIGAMMGLPSKEDEKGFTFISSQSPLKNADPSSDSGKSKYQSEVDKVANVFVSAISRNRNSSVEKVLSDYGKGGLLVGQEAVDAGMVDGIALFDDVLSMLSESGAGRTNSQNRSSLMTMKNQAGEAKAETSAEATEKVDVQEITAKAEKEAAQKAADRLDQILSCEAAENAPSTAKHIATKTSISASDAIGILDVVAGEIEGAKASSESAGGGIMSSEQFEQKKNAGLEVAAPIGSQAKSQDPWAFRQANKS